MKLDNIPHWTDPEPRWCKTCDAVVPCSRRALEDAWYCDEHGHVTTGLEDHDHRREQTPPAGRHPLDVAARHTHWGEDGDDGDVITWRTGTVQPTAHPDADLGLWRHMAQRRDGHWHKILAHRAHPLTWDQLLADLARSRAHNVIRYTADDHPTLWPPVELRPAPRRRHRQLIPWDRYPR